MSTVTTSTVSRKRRHSEAELIVRLSTPLPSDVDDASVAGPSTGPRIIVNGVLTSGAIRKYKCLYEGCKKAYTKPSRLAEHERSHTGERPFVCSVCNKSYSRETHLQAHTRSHLPESERPFVCLKGGCEKRFWTSQHLRAHEEWHRGEKPFQCTHEGCQEAFTKHHQLRAHVCSAHSPPGTKPYICTREGCDKSFATNQKLRTHLKVHDDKRYTCVHPSCQPSVFYPTWTALQAHIRTAHPPTCPYSQCGGRTFTQQKGLRAHMKLHASEEEFKLKMPVGEGDEGREIKRRRGGEWGREWVCGVDGCGRDFKSKKALGVHVNVTHFGKRDHICPTEGCGARFGYKHLLQRHTARRHQRGESSDAPSNDEEPQPSESEEETMPDGGIDFLTGKAYADGAKEVSTRKLRCPFPDAPFLQTGTGQRCEYAFSRAYDLRRHLRAIHAVEAVKEDVDVWVAAERKSGRGGL
ncbi:hypothetical protein NEOLEDRAFT_1126721 [Neolentinus lepideus HHB14362 ss-1]|uniref:C2H2-type domain-containing protein n=1 Tax=Neolentinus lepideus HHB14362 ss-1 TaxID=1314782 RepID=A0A165VPY9_9AGAM|nr:hypothetical protein NEOLEDRAFT_1126721 [Neolentinus lepideus HHB14362 ss-1]